MVEMLCKRLFDIGTFFKNAGLQPVGARSMGYKITGSLMSFENTKCKNFKSHNEKIYEPQLPHEEPRPGFVCHVKEHVKYSYKKMWYVACLVRGLSIDEALKQLQFVKLEGANIARDTLLEAQKMAVEEHNIEFKTNLWVSESFVGKSTRIKGIRRCARKRIVPIHYDYIHYFVTLEEGKPPENYYFYRKKKTGAEMLEEWIEEMRQRKVIDCL